jgi:putative endonuclease
MCSSATRRGVLIGSSENVDDRLNLHNAGKVTATKYQRPFRLVYTEEFQTRADARRREAWLKRQKSRILLDELIAKGQGSVG